MLVLLLMLAEDPGVLIARARATLGIVRCPVEGDAGDVTVCGRRHADRYRVPLLTATEPGADPASNAAAERQALLHRTTQIQELSPFLVGGGLAGVTATVGSGSGKATVSGVRPLAP